MEPAGLGAGKEHGPSELVPRAWASSPAGQGDVPTAPPEDGSKGGPEPPREAETAVPPPSVDIPAAEPPPSTDEPAAAAPGAVPAIGEPAAGGAEVPSSGEGAADEDAPKKPGTEVLAKKQTKRKAASRTRKTAKKKSKKRKKKTRTKKDPGLKNTKYGFFD